MTDENAEKARRRRKKAGKTQKGVETAERKRETVRKVSDSQKDESTKMKNENVWKRKRDRVGVQEEQ